MNRLVFSASAVLLTTVGAHAQTPGTYIFGGGSSPLSSSVRNQLTESGLVAGVGVMGRLSARQVGAPAVELLYTRLEDKGRSLTGTGIAYIERAPTTHGARSYYGFGLGVAQLSFKAATASGNQSSSRATRATSLPTKDNDGTRVLPTFLLGTPLGSKAFVEARYIGLGSIQGVRADQYALTLGIRL